MLCWIIALVANENYNDVAAVANYNEWSFDDEQQQQQLVSNMYRQPATAPLGNNPFESGNYYVNSDYQSRVRSSMHARWAAGNTRDEMAKMLSVPSAFWVDRIAKIRRATAGAGAASLESTLEDAAAKVPPPLVVVILCARERREPTCALCRRTCARRFLMQRRLKVLCCVLCFCSALR